MTFVRPDLFSLVCFCLILAFQFFVILQAIRGAGCGLSRASALFVGYLAVFSAVVLLDLPSKSPIPVVPLLFLSVLGTSLYFAFSKIGSKIAANYSLALLIGFQGFRFPLEIILHHWAVIGTIPETMTWTGQNFDIVAGILSIAAAPFVNQRRWLAIGVQTVSFLLLLNVLRVVVMSGPFPFSWPLTTPLLLINYLPYALIGPLCVGAAFAGHLITFRRLYRT
jgi:hypothetical protein